MGNTTSEHKHNKKSSVDPKRQFIETQFTCYYNELIRKYSKLDKESFIKLFGEELYHPLWNYYSSNSDDSISLNKFISKSEPLFETDHKIWEEIFNEPEDIIKACLLTSDIEEANDDKDFKESIICNMKKDGISKFIQNECPRLCDGIREHVISLLTDKKKNLQDYSSSILTPFQMLFIKASLNPVIYFNKEGKNNSNRWTKLYDSSVHGVSLNRFENNVYDYKKPTVTIFKLTNGQLIVIALDEEWKNSVNCYGGNNTSVIQIKPKFEREDKSGSFRCNLKLKSAPMGIQFGRYLKIEKDFSNVNDIEVWGCGAEDDLTAQMKQKVWYKKEAEKRSKVPLPGAWDENPDKTILEMGGIKLNNERRDFDRPDDTIARKF
ncbi:TLDc domain-containing protein [Strongyloides ratti]|uniref:TLDc domain-containing protein n=1 Tax=Strongyloides ratti TaxID=34506 RepID=A0A090LA50_STRRB|nr:TLDc domain-containing protein [Strongyloides ratti]CEF64390.1 TLDc domain-containing protein [Strongyloides ratti]